MSLNDVYEVTLTQVMQGQTVNNIFFYHQALEFVTTNPTKAQSLVEAWVDQILPGIYGMQPEEVLTTEVKARNLYDGSDAYTQTLSIPGDIPDDRQLMPSFVTVSYALNGDNADVKNGAKRFAGMSEDNQNDGVVTGGAFMTLLDDLGDLLEAPVLIGILLPDPCFVPVIVKRVRSGSPGAYEYRLPNNALEATLSLIVVALWDVILKHQITRDIGRGI